MTWRRAGQLTAPSGTIHARRPRHAGSALFVVAALLLLTRCGGTPQPAAPQTGMPSPAASAQSPRSASQAIATPAIGEVIWTAATDPTLASSEPVDHFATVAPRLTAVVPASDVRPGSTIDATWMYNDTPLEAFATRVTVEDAEPQHWFGFHLERSPDVPWPSGIYEIAISLDGAPMRSASVEVRDPE